MCLSVYSIAPKKKSDEGENHLYRSGKFPATIAGTPEILIQISPTRPIGGSAAAAARQ
jgi:hypothetical protein